MVMYLLAARTPNALPLYRDKAVAINKGWGVVYYVVTLNPAEYALAVLLLKPEHAWDTRCEGILCQTKATYMPEFIYDYILDRTCTY